MCPCPMGVCAVVGVVRGGGSLPMIENKAIEMSSGFCEVGGRINLGVASPCEPPLPALAYELVQYDCGSGPCQPSLRDRGD